MDIRALILGLLEKNGQVKASQVVKKTGFSRAYVNRFFKQLRDEGKLVLLGKANKARYVPATQTAVQGAKKEVTFVRRILTNKNLFEHDILTQIKKNSTIFHDLAKNVSAILDYAFTEMLNNAIEHSQSLKIETTMEKRKDNISFCVIDKGVGIFNNIMKKRKLNNTMEAVQDLLKGKQSTAPEIHSGEGIFFTSKAADIFTIQSGHKKILFNNLLEDIFVKDIKNVAGTKVFFSIGFDSKKKLNDIFKKFTDDAFSFSKTEVKVKLYKAGVDHISRSQARRIISGLDKFKKIILDFENVDTVGQGFADEIFRVWQSRNARVKIEAANANENIRFMINRARAASME